METNSAKRRGNPAMVAGGPSLNPNGRPASAISIARQIAPDVPELVARLLELSRDPAVPTRERLQATAMLLDRAAGKPLQPSEIALAVSQADSALPAEWLAMTGPQRLAWCDATRQRALGGRS